MLTLPLTENGFDCSSSAAPVPCWLQSSVNNQQCCISYRNAALHFQMLSVQGLLTDILSLKLTSPKIVALGWSSLPAGPAQPEEGESEGI